MERERAIQILHEGHPGMTRMKAIAQGAVWWPGINAKIERKIKECLNAKCIRNFNLWLCYTYGNGQVDRLHIDVAGPFEGRMFLVVVDSHSKCLDVISVLNANSATTIHELRELFTIHGIPEIVVSDNGTTFTSAEFSEFIARNSIRRLRTAPYLPATNGLAECAVQMFKTAMTNHLVAKLILYQVSQISLSL